MYLSIFVVAGNLQNVFVSLFTFASFAIILFIFFLLLLFYHFFPQLASRLLFMDSLFK